MIRQAEADAKAEAEQEEFRESSSRNSRVGRHSEPARAATLPLERALAPAAQRKVEQHVAIAERFPFMQAPAWKQYHVLEASALARNRVVE